MADARNPGAAHDRGGDDRGERSNSAPYLKLHDKYPGGEWLDPAWSMLKHGFELVDKARVALMVVAGSVALLYVGAKVEREMQKRRLTVVEGQPEKEASGGD